MKVLILGGDSMLAYALRQVFSFETMVAFSRKTCDITNPTQVNCHIANLRPDIVINCAAYTDVDLAQHHPNMCECINADAIRTLASSCKKYDARIVHFSTEMVFGQEDENGYDEGREPVRPVNVYGQTKLVGERYLRQSWNKHWIVRTSWLFGPGGRRANFIDKVLDRARHDDEIDVVNDVRACPTYSFDLARAVYDLVREPADFGTYHLTNHGSATKSQWAREIIDFTVGDCRVNELSSKNFMTLAKRPHHGVLINNKRPPLRSWIEGMEEYLIGIGELFRHR